MKNRSRRASTVTSNIARPQAKSSVAATRKTSAEASAWTGAVLQTAREGTIAELAALLQDLVASGDIVEEEAESKLDADRLLAEETLDSEIKLADFDDPQLESFNQTDLSRDHASFAPARGLSMDLDSADLPGTIELLVSGTKCRVHWPSWLRGSAVTDHGEKIMNEVGQRFSVLNALGAWLERERPEFLANPDPWHLGVNALAELRSGLTSVRPEHFLKMANLGANVTEDLFSRYTSDCRLVWKTGELPLKFIFETEARNAWVGRAITQLAEHYGSELDVVLETARVTRPRTTAKKDALLKIPADQERFHQTISKANVLAQTRWAEVAAMLELRRCKRT